jgi:hypothetical protein
LNRTVATKDLLIKPGSGSIWEMTLITELIPQRAKGSALLMDRVPVIAPLYMLPPMPP